MGHKRRANRSKKWSEDVGDGPIIILKPPDELAKDGSNFRISCLHCRRCTFDVHFACRNKIAKVIHRAAQFFPHAGTHTRWPDGVSSTRTVAP